jgi:predicted dinucleotide-binding enzyme
MLSRTPESEAVQAWLRDAGDNASAGSHAEGASWCELAVLATAWTGAADAIELCSAGNLAGKIVIDVTNPLAPGSVEPGSSAGETVQRWLPESKVVKSFNIVNNQDMVEPSYPSGTPTMLIAGDDDSAKSTVTALLHSFGWEDVIDLGGIDTARLTEGLVALWVRTGQRVGTWRLAFSVLRPANP